MKAKEMGLLSFLDGTKQYILPAYKGQYSWTERECTQLWSDVVALTQKPAHSSHFIGTVVYSEAKSPQAEAMPQLTLIDGFQRLVTLSLLIAALAYEAQQRQMRIQGLDAQKIRSYYLINSDQKGDARNKILLKKTDKKIYTAIISGELDPNEMTSPLQHHFHFFSTKLKEHADLTAIFTSLEQVIIVEIALEAERDDPQQIYASITAKPSAAEQPKAKPPTPVAVPKPAPVAAPKPAPATKKAAVKQAVPKTAVAKKVVAKPPAAKKAAAKKPAAKPQDEEQPKPATQPAQSPATIPEIERIRELLVGQAPRQAKHFTATYWQIIRGYFSQEPNDDRLYRFLRDFAMMHAGRIIPRTNILPSYTDLVNENSNHPEKLLQELVAAAEYYTQLCYAQLINKVIKANIKRFNRLLFPYEKRQSIHEIAYPFFMYCMRKRAAGSISDTDFSYTINIIENYLFRHIICKIPTTATHISLISLIQDIDQSPGTSFIERVVNALESRKESQRCPNDEDFINQLLIKDFSQCLNKDYFFERLLGGVFPQGTRIAPIIPDDAVLSHEWNQKFGKQWQLIQTTYRHRLSNLSLVRFQPKHDSAYYTKKRTMDGGWISINHPFNQELATRNTWDKANIEARALRLAKQAANTWIYPLFIARSTVK